MTKYKYTKAGNNPQHKRTKLIFVLLLLLPFSFCLFSFQQQAFSKSFSELKNSSFSSEHSAACTKVTCGVYNGVRLDGIAKSITVKVLSGNTWGSGILLQRQGEVYTVVTNRHVLNLGNYPYIIQTPDGKTYQANLPSRNMRFGGNDLALLQFSSQGSFYAVASLKSSKTLSEGDRVFAAGFPFDGRGFLLTKGRVSLLPDQALEQGYKIGYTNDIQKGMSGGPLLNRQGEVVGINGMHAYPLWGDPYVYRDGSLPSAEVRDRMIALAFAIPIDTCAQLAPQFASLPDSLPSPNGGVNRSALALFLDLFTLKPSQPIVHPKPVGIDSVFVE
ncbi:MAG TPA: serine protease [Kamptonema sp.]|nr:serine protease [Kamptonema sp.]